MTTSTMTLTDFLLARIAEDEAAARAVDGRYEDAQWHSKPGDHLDRWGPERVLAECVSKRWIVNRGPDSCSGPDGHIQHAMALEALALPYVDHPDFDPEWAEFLSDPL